MIVIPLRILSSADMCRVHLKVRSFQRGDQRVTTRRRACNAGGTWGFCGAGRVLLACVYGAANVQARATAGARGAATAAASAVGGGRDAAGRACHYTGVGDKLPECLDSADDIWCGRGV